MFRSNSFTVFKRNSHQNLVSNAVHSDHSEKHLSLFNNMCINYHSKRYITLDNPMEEHPNITIAIDKCNKKEVVVKKCKNIKNELKVVTEFYDCDFIEKIIQYDTVQNIVIYNFNINKDLSHYMCKHPLSVYQSTHIVLKPILQAVEYIHSKGYGHRDIKPENILYYTSGCKLIDFEFCEKLPSCGYFSNRDGTLEFMAPEVTQRKGCLESDVWSLGLVYYECLHDKLPYYQMKYDKNNFENLFEQIRNKRIMIDIDLDLTIVAILKIMLSRDVKSRIQCYDKIHALINSLSF